MGKLELGKSFTLNTFCFTSQIAFDLAKMGVHVVLDFVAAYQGFKDSFVKWKVCEICTRHDFYIFYMIKAVLKVMLRSHLERGPTEFVELKI